MLELRKVAVTGGLACGKSTVCSFLGELGASTVSADTIVRQLLSTDVAIIQRVVDLLGHDVLVDGRLIPSEIAKRVFGNSELLKSLEDLLHPTVKRVVEERYEVERGLQKAALFVVEVPLLFEARVNFRSWFDLAVCVIASEERARQMYRDFDARVARQWSLWAKAALSDIILENHGGLEELRKATRALFYQVSFWQF